MFALVSKRNKAVFAMRLACTATVLLGVTSAKLCGRLPHQRILHCDDSKLESPYVAPMATKPTKSSSTLSTVFHNILSGVALLTRLLQLLLIFFPPMLSRIVFNAETSQWESKLLHALELSGPFFQKFAQWTCTLYPQSIVSQDILDALQRMSFPVEPLEHTLFTIQESGYNAELLTGFKAQPIGVGCVAQVHEAFIAGKPVAVKVIKRNVKQQLQRDMDVLRFLSLAFEYCWFLPQVVENAPQFVDRFALYMEAQCDLRNEASNLTELNAQQPKRKRNQRQIQVVFPTPLLPATESVLVETLHTQGVPLSMFVNKATQTERTNIVNSLVRAFFEMALTNNLSHADLHWDNIHVSNTRTSNGTINELVLLDAGLVATLTPLDKSTFISIVEACAVETDVAKALDVLFARLTNSELLENRKDLIQKLVFMIDAESERILDKQDNINFAILCPQVVDLLLEHKVKINAPGFTNLFTAFLILDGTVRKLDTEWNAFSYTYVLLDIL